jgi:hypothetical protein
MDNATVTDGFIEGFNETYVHGYTSFFRGRVTIAQPVSSLSSICIVFCAVVHELNQTSPLKSGISLLARINPRCVLYQEFMFALVLVFGLTLTTEP